MVLFLTAELADNLKVKGGSFKEFLRKEKALLLIPKKGNYISSLKSYRLKVIASNQWGYVAYKQS